ncbi:glycohydrolase toxin TNT-related protein [Actinoalloteichus hymeniacidonis]|uniref:DUF4237 family protein n=1 Tax=Actinoalloteichus hymeniacidonis TaxID=340345 RepID=A0AAC9N198_9PSEU|nr:glycohydrolase toxin TNT-related protein [Actinoalloteichus hymeniacidonis]AOS65686.1 putative DUF4237 family protein [Actinoalloteichus hymeniacidonis]MBB5906224.1 hypothetical protein [Actinoalloteichus hymeniacidonis]
MSRPTANSQEDQAVLARDIGMALLQAAPPGWQQIRVEYRAMGSVTDAVGKVINEDGSTASWEPPADCGPLFERLRQNMYEPEKGTWLSALYVVERPSNYRIDVNVDKKVPWDPPLPPNAFHEELNRYPREDSAIPPWFWRGLGRPDRTQPPSEFDEHAGSFPEDQFAETPRPDPSIRRPGPDHDDAHTDYLPEMPADGPPPGLNNPGFPGAGAYERNGAAPAGHETPGYEAAGDDNADFRSTAQSHEDSFQGDDAESFPTQQYPAQSFDDDFPDKNESYLEEGDYEYAEDEDQPAAPDFQLARVFDGTREDGRPLINRAPVDPAEREQLVGYLRSAPVVLSSSGLAPDPFAGDNRPSVPISWHTDGFWIWPAAVGYHLARHGVPPLPELVEHIRDQEFRLPSVHQETRDAATELLYEVLPDPRDERHSEQARQAAAAEQAANYPAEQHDDPYDSLANDVTGILPAAIPADEPAAQEPIQSHERDRRGDDPRHGDPRGHGEQNTGADRPEHSDQAAGQYYDEGYGEQPGYQEDAGTEQHGLGADPHGFLAAEDAYPRDDFARQEQPQAHEDLDRRDRGAAGQYADYQRADANPADVASNIGPADDFDDYAAEQSAADLDDVAEATEEVDQASLDQLRDRLADLEVAESAYRIGGTEDDVWCLLREGRTWSVFWSEHGERYDEIRFDQSNQACAYLLGALLMMHPSEGSYTSGENAVAPAPMGVRSEVAEPAFTEHPVAEDELAIEDEPAYQEPEPVASASVIRPPRAMNEDEVADLFRNGGLVLPPSRPYSEEETRGYTGESVGFEAPTALDTPAEPEPAATSYEPAAQYEQAQYEPAQHESAAEVRYDTEVATGSYDGRQSYESEPAAAAPTRSPGRAARRRAAEQPSDYESYEQELAVDAGAEADRVDSADATGYSLPSSGRYGDDVAGSRQPTSDRSRPDQIDHARRSDAEYAGQDESEFGRRSATDFSRPSVIDHRRPEVEYARQGASDHAGTATDYSGGSDSSGRDYDTHRMSAVEVGDELDDRVEERGFTETESYQPESYHSGPDQQERYRDDEYQSSGGYGGSFGGDTYRDDVVGTEPAGVNSTGLDQQYDRDRYQGDTYDDGQYQEGRYQDDRYQDQLADGRYDDDPEPQAEPEVPARPAGRRGATDFESRAGTGYESQSGDYENHRGEDYEPRAAGGRRAAPEPQAAPENYELAPDLGTSARRQSSGQQQAGRQQAAPARPQQATEQQSMVRPLAGEPPLTLFRERRLVMLQAGTEVDRFGEPTGNVTYAAGTPYSRRSLPPQWIKRSYHTYRLLRPLQVLTGIAVPWFEQPGGGVSYVLPRSINDLIEDSALAEVTDVEPPGME